MVAAGLFNKNGDNLEKKESPDYRKKVESIKTGLNHDHSRRQTLVTNKKMLAGRLLRRKQKIAELMARNRGRK